MLGGNTDHFGPSYQHPPAWDLGGNVRPDLVDGHGRPPGGRDRVVDGGARTRRRRRVRALRPVLVRDHPPVRGVRVLRRGRGRRLRDERRDRARWQAPGHHRRRPDVVQPRRRDRAAAAAGHPRRAAAARRVRRPCRSTAPRSRCAAAAARARCSPTCCCWEGSSHEQCSRRDRDHQPAVPLRRADRRRRLRGHRRAPRPRGDHRRRLRPRDARGRRDRRDVPRTRRASTTTARRSPST